jgi:hypothetical protein
LERRNHDGGAWTLCEFDQPLVDAEEVAGLVEHDEQAAIGGGGHAGVECRSLVSIWCCGFCQGQQDVVGNAALGDGVVQIAEVEGLWHETGPHDTLLGDRGAP